MLFPCDIFDCAHTRAYQNMSHRSKKTANLSSRLKETISHDEKRPAHVDPTCARRESKEKYKKEHYLRRKETNTL